jgi:hypothetical protein
MDARVGLSCWCDSLLLLLLLLLLPHLYLLPLLAVGAHEHSRHEGAAQRGCGCGRCFVAGGSLQQAYQAIHGCMLECWRAWHTSGAGPLPQAVQLLQAVHAVSLPAPTLAASSQGICSIPSCYTLSLAACGMAGRLLSQPEPPTVLVCGWW